MPENIPLKLIIASLNSHKSKTNKDTKITKHYLEAKWSSSTFVFSTLQR